VSGARRLAHLLCPCSSPRPFPPAAETLADAWRAALAVDGRLRAADADADAARASLEAARGLALPKATASSSYTVLSKEPAARIGLPTLPGIALPDQMPLSERTYATHALQATLPVYTGGRITAAINAADIGVQASAFERSRSEQAVKLDVAEAWLVLRSRRALAAAERHLAALDAHALDVDDLHKQGLVPRNDVLSVAVARADARQQLTRARHGVDLAAAAYNRLLRRPLDSPVDAAEPPRWTPIVTRSPPSRPAPGACAPSCPCWAPGPRPPTRRPKWNAPPAARRWASAPPCSTRTTATGSIRTWPR
jgi:outer membrane protein TolC